MNITPAELLAEYTRAAREWPFIADVERKHNLPRCLLFAVGSRETNLTNETGDGGHGRGVFQLDDRSHAIPKQFPVTAQAEKAGAMLAGLIAYFHGNLKSGVAAYNCGEGGVENALREHGNADAGTTGGDYAADVLGRMAWLQKSVPRPDGSSPLAPATVSALKLLAGNLHGRHHAVAAVDGERTLLAQVGKQIDRVLAIKEKKK